jgi:hypothetical protein
MRKTAVLSTKEDLLIDLIFHDAPASLLTDFTEEIVRPCNNGNMNVAMQDLIRKAITEQNFVLSRIPT